MRSGTSAFSDVLRRSYDYAHFVRSAQDDMRVVRMARTAERYVFV
jgi:hypothetical protein